MELEDVFRIPNLTVAYAVRLLGAPEHDSFEGSISAPVQTSTAVLPDIKFCVVLLRLVLQDTMRTGFDLYPYVRSNEKVYGNNINIQSEKAEEATKAGRTVYEELKRQVEAIMLRLAFKRRRQRGKHRCDERCGNCEKQGQRAEDERKDDKRPTT